MLGLMKKKMGIFFAWQVFVIWMAISGTITFICSYGAFRKYYLVRMRASKGPGPAGEKQVPIHFPKFLLSPCSSKWRCIGDGMDCRNNICICARGYEARGKVCVPKIWHHEKVSRDRLPTPDLAGDLTASGMLRTTGGHKQTVGHAT